MKFPTRILPFLALILVTFLSFQNRWHYTLSGDIKNYYFPIAQHIFTAQTLIYPPGANLFFLLLPASTFEIYQLAFIGANIFFIILLLKIIKNPVLLGFLVFAAGPIILFRFDLLVVLLTIFSIKAFQNSNFTSSGLFLGIATITKLFPLLLLPYFLLVLWPKKKVISFLMSFLLAIMVILTIYSNIAQLGFSTIISGLYFNFSKSVHMESVLGSALTIITFFTNPGPHGVQFINALWVLNPLYLLGHARIFRLFPLGGLAIIYAGIIFLFRKTKNLNISWCLLIILALIITSQVFSPQYLLWIAFLIPLLPLNRINFFLIIFALVCTQIIYPLNYGELIDFFNLGKNPWLFGVLVIRNLALVVLAIRLFKHEILLPILPKK